MWILFAFLAPAIYSIANILDNFLANKKFKHPIALVFYSFAFNIVFVPILFLFQPLQIPPVSLIPIFLLLGVVNVSYLYPYYRGLQTADTSVAMAFFGLGRVIIPILAFFIVGEVLEFSQYLGIFFIIVGTTFLSLSQVEKKLRFSKALGYIALAAFITAFEGVLLKYLFDHGINVSTALGGEMTVSAILALSFLIPRKTRREVVFSFSVFKATVLLFIIEEAFTFMAFASETYALSDAPVSIIKSITMLTPFFLMLYAWIFGKKFPQIFKEEVKTKIVLKKIICFGIIVAGVALLKV